MGSESSPAGKQALVQPKEWACLIGPRGSGSASSLMKSPTEGGPCQLSGLTLLFTLISDQSYRATTRTWSSTGCTILHAMSFSLQYIHLKENFCLDFTAKYIVNVRQYDECHPDSPYSGILHFHSKWHGCIYFHDSSEAGVTLHNECQVHNWEHVMLMLSFQAKHIFPALRWIAICISLFFWFITTNPSGALSLGMPAEQTHMRRLWRSQGPACFALHLNK